MATAVNGDEEGEFVMVEAAKRADDEGRMHVSSLSLSLAIAERQLILRNCKPPLIMLLYYEL